MSDYQLTATDAAVIRTEDGACIPNDPANRDWVVFQGLIADGGVPDPYVEPEPVPPEPTDAQLFMYDHELRLREFVGEPLALDLADFITKLAPA